MDTVMDPELAAEMVKLLGQELKVVRSQLREAEQRSGTPLTSDLVSPGLHFSREEALQAEIAALKAENAGLQANISSRQDQTASVPVKMEGGHSSLVTQYEASMSAIQRELANAIREKNTAIMDKENLDGQLQEMNSIREKCRKLKADKRECQEIINELRGQLLIYVEEHEQVSAGKPLESDPPSFFRNTKYPDVVDQPKRSDIPVYSKALSMGIPKSARTHRSCDGVLRLEKDVLMFAHAGISLGLILRPMYQYNPKKANGTWDQLPQDIEPGKKKELCYYDGQGWKYLGIYERIGDSFRLSPATIEKLSSPRVEAIAKQTVLFQDLVSPSQMRMVEKMYWDGLLQIEMFGIQCVAYNQEFAKHLEKFGKDAASRSNKRKRSDETGETHNRRQKKIHKDGTIQG